MIRVSVIICTYSPRSDYLKKVIDGYLRQTFDDQSQELIIVDSASPIPLEKRTDLQIPAWAKIIRAPTTGLGLARLLGAQAADSELIASLDDDTIMAPDYLKNAVSYLDSHPRCASVSGRLSGEFETHPPDWISEFHPLLALRDLGEEIIVLNDNYGAPLKEYPTCAPLGVNITRRTLCLEYQREWAQSRQRQRLGRNARSLDSGEDNDFALYIIKKGWGVAYLPSLQLIHQIPSTRLHPHYLGRLSEASHKTWCRVLLLNGISPWTPIPRWTLQLRKAKAWFVYRAWAGPCEYIRWRGACGHFEGRIAP